MQQRQDTKFFSKQKIIEFLKKAKSVLGKFFLKTSLGQCLMISAILVVVLEILGFQSLIDAGKLKVEIVDGRMVVVLASDVLFASGSANLSRDGKSAIGEVAALLADIPDRKFQIEGHTDNVPIRTAVYPSNWELASARALTVLKTMLEAGMPADRISAASFGDSKPARDNETPEGKAANRRIEIVVTPDLSTLPGFEELNRVATDAS